MSKIDKQEYKYRIREYLEYKNVDFNTRVNPPVMRCLIPGHDDRNPSAVIYEDKVWCPVCNESYDIFKCAGFLIASDDFKLQVKDIQETLNITQRDDNRLISLSKTEAETIFNNDKNYEWFLKDKKDCQITGKWFYYNKYNDVDICDVRFDYIDDKDKKRKDIISFYYNGEYVKCKNYPVLIYNRHLIEQEPDTPILIVEGPKCADAALKLKKYIPITWNGGCKKYKKPDWSVIKNRTIYIWPDDDEPGIDTSFGLKKILQKNNEVKVLKPMPELRKLKTKGADIIEAFQIYDIDALIDYIDNSLEFVQENPDAPTCRSNAGGAVVPSKRSTAGNTKKNDTYSNKIFPFEILGVADDGKAYFIDRSDRLQKYNLCGIAKPQLLMLAQRAWWIMSDFGNGESKVYWDMAIDSLIEESNKIDFNLDNLRGRGAWKDNDNLIYNDGKIVNGKTEEKGVIYLRKSQVDIGINDNPLDYDTRRAMRDLIFKLSFETPADAIRCIAWATLAPFGGCLYWRPAILITGPSGSGKTTIANNVIRKIANPVWLDGSESTPAGVRGLIQNDTCSIVFEEAETDTVKKRENRKNLFSLMRTNTSDDSPDTAKGTSEGGVRSYKMRNMFCFIAISPEIDSIADENRIFKINLKIPAKSKWQDTQSLLNRIMTVRNCRGLRSFVWKNLENIIKKINLIIPFVQTKNDMDFRYCYAESLLLSAYFNVWSDKELTDEYLEAAIDQFYKWLPTSGARDETDEIIDRLMDQLVPVTGYNDKQTIREIIQTIYTGKETSVSMGTETETDIEPKKIITMRQVLHRYGIDVNSDGEIAIANNHHEIMNIIEKGKGYHMQLVRHKNCVDKSRVVSIAKKSRRCVVLKDIIEYGIIKDINDSEVPF